MAKSYLNAGEIALRNTISTKVDNNNVSGQLKLVNNKVVLVLHLPLDLAPEDYQATEGQIAEELDGGVCFKLDYEIPITGSGMSDISFRVYDPKSDTASYVFKSAKVDLQINGEAEKVDHGLGLAVTTKVG